MYNRNEIILAAKRCDIVTDSNHMRGVLDDYESAELLLRFQRHMFESRRGQVEYNTAYIQPICYILIKRGDQYYTYERLLGGGFDRRFGVRSLGVGGHMSPLENVVDFETLITYNTQKRIRAEVAFSSSDRQLQMLGVLLDDSNLTNTCHFGVLGVLQVEENTIITEREVENTNGQWVSKQDLIQNYDEYESWSQILIDYIKKAKSL